jgi:serine/threonine protein kinase
MERHRHTSAVRVNLTRKGPTSGWCVILDLFRFCAIKSIEAMALAPGTRFGPYELLAPIGAGGMGEVYRARDTRLDRIVAIKVVDEQFSNRFEREARAVAALNHSNICQVYDVGPNYLVMECIEGTPLKGPLPVSQALKYAAQICDALDTLTRRASRIGT